MTPDEFFAGDDTSWKLFEAVRQAMAEIGPAELKVTKSQIAFCRRVAFAWVWRPGQYLRGQTAPLVLTFIFHYRNQSPRWKQVVEPKPGHFTHHLELYVLADIDNDVLDWLRESWLAAA